MATERRLIDAEPYDEFLAQYAQDLFEADAPMIAGAIERCQRALKTQPTVDAVEVPDKELLKAIKLLIKQYEHSRQSNYVHSPVAHALFHTWKQVDERRTE